MTSPLSTAAPAATALYRGLLREVTKQVTKKNNNPTWQRYLRAQFEVVPADAAQHRARLVDAENALLFLRSNRTHRELLEGYFPVLAEDERIKRTAGKVGLQLPRMFDPDGDVARDSSSSTA
ncbi:hypothetical protein H9P43_005136 [Blastocladiella emersonii ATCC 22665]|nr:hypothetical protein H9P43_005136 [Blastocladiella emersonii ATCC 22665]